jgi:non-ribosomal peptide synthetase component F
MIQELMTLYSSYLNGGNNNLLPLRIQYKDYALWQQKQLKEQAFHRHRKYWLDKFTGSLPVLNLPTDFPRPAIKTFKGSSINKILNNKLVGKIRRFCLENEGTVYMALMAAVNALLYRYSGQEDIIVGSPIAGRESAELENQIGLYVNTIAIRLNPTGNSNYNDLFSQAKKVSLEAYEHQQYPFDELISELSLPRDKSRNLLFDVMVILQNTGSALASNEIAGLRIKPLELDRNDSKFDLTFSFMEIEDEIVLSLGYSSDLFDKKTAERLSSHFVQLLDQLLLKPTEKLEDINFLDDKELELILRNFNNPEDHNLSNNTILDLFYDQVLSAPNDIALVFAEKKITYKELDERSSRF